MEIRDEKLIVRMMRYFGGLERGIKKLETEYPSLPEKIEEILREEEKFPMVEESPTGSKFLLFHKEHGISSDIILQYLDEEYKCGVTVGPFTNEEWQAIILKDSYGFPKQYALDSRVIRAVEESFIIQKQILESASFMQYVKSIEALPPLTSEPMYETPRWKYFETKRGEYNPKDVNIALWIGSVARRITQIVYSIEEAKYKERIFSIIGTPIAEVRREIEERIQNGEVFE